MILGMDIKTQIGYMFLFMWCVACSFHGSSVSDPTPLAELKHMLYQLLSAAPAFFNQQLNAPSNYQRADSS
jgi:hypothetical protein